MNKITSIIIFLSLSQIVTSLPKVCLEHEACYEGNWLQTEAALGIFASFQGIRYAQSPENDLRFKPPKSYQDAKGTYNVSQEVTIACPQFDENNQNVIGQEDCLFLNVYVPKSAFDDPNVGKIPVMIWIHGGGLQYGGNWYSRYGPKHFIDKDVIVVAINYRLNILGFLTLGNEDAPGNLGLRDQILALSWVQEYIERFGGDPGSVTIFGESAGALSVQLHLLSPMSKGLFQRAIIQSGSGICLRSRVLSPEEALASVDYVLDYFGCNQTIMEKLQCLQNQSIEKLLEFYSSNHPEIVNNTVLFSFSCMFTIIVISREMCTETPVLMEISRLSLI